MVTLFCNGRICTQEGTGKYVSAMVSDNGYIVAVGSVSDLRNQFPHRTEVDLEGKLVLPAFTDAHTHFASFCLSQNDVNLAGVSSVEECLFRVQSAAQRLPEGKWIRGSGWNQNLWSPPAFPSREQLDRVAPRHPVYLDARDYHSAWVNSLALASAGVTSSSVWNDNGEIVKNADGQPTGILKEEARQLIWRVLPEPTATDTAEALRQYQHLAFQNGFCSIGSMETLRDWEAFQLLHTSGELKIRVAYYMPIRFLDDAVAAGIHSGDGDERLRFGGMKIFMDGTLGSQTASMLQPYEGSTNYGTEITSEADATAWILKAADHNIACAVHAIGDRANRNVLNAFESLHRRRPAHGLRSRIEHCQLVSPDDIPRFGRLGVIASMQPIHIPEDIDTAERQWGTRCEGAYAFRSLLRHGAVLAFGSDVPIETCNVFEGMYSALRRTRRGSTDSWYAGECLDLPEIIHAYTIGAAFATGEESIKGRLLPGYLADFMIVSQDIFSVEPEAIPSTRIEHMVVGGEIVL